MTMTKNASDKAKENGVRKAQFIRQAALRWLELHKADVLSKIREVADKKFPKSEKAKDTFELPREIASMK
jgi:hypothetical protein